MAGAGLEYKSRAGARQEQKEGQDRSRSGGGQEFRFHANTSPVYLNWMKNSKVKILLLIGFDRSVQLVKK